MKKILKITNFIFIFLCLFYLSSCMLKKPSVSLGGSNDSDRDYYTITYNLNDGRLVGTPTSEFLDYSSVVLPSSVKTGYIFDGWYEGDTKVEKVTENRDYNLTAKFNLINYQITYELNGGSMTTCYKSRSEIVNDFMNDFNTYTKQNLTIDDYINLGSMFGISNESKFLYAYIEKWGWLVDFIKTVADSSNKSAWNSFKNYTSQSGLNEENSNYIYSIAYELRAFVGGFKYEKNSAFPTQDYSKSTIENKLWSFIPKSSYTIVSNDIDLTNKIYQPIKEGYSFDCWCKDSQLSNPIFSISSGSHSNLVLYASWTKLTKYTFDPNGGELDYCVYEGVNSSVFDLPIPTKDGYTFNGWIDDNGNSLPLYSENEFQLGSEDKIYYAQWEETYTTYLSFYEEDEEISIDSEDVLYVFVPFSEGDLDVYYQQHYILDSLELNDLEFDGHEYDIYITYFDEDESSGAPAGFYLNFGVFDNSISYVGTLEQKIYKGENYCGDIYSFKIIENYSESITFSTFNDDYKLVKSFSNSSYEKIEGSLGIDEVTYYLYVSYELQNEELVTLGLFPNSSDSEVLGLFVGIYTVESSTNVHIFLDNTSNDVSNSFTVCEFVKQCDDYAIFKFNLNVNILYDYNCDLLKISYSNSDLVYLINYNE